MAQIGRVGQLWRFPVKSMAGEAVSQVELTADGVLGDRAWALLDVESGRIVSAKDVRHFPNLLRCRAAFASSPALGAEWPPVTITLPNGEEIHTADPEASRRLSRGLGREVRLVREAPADYTVNQHHPDLGAADAPMGPVKTAASKLGSALFAQLGVVPSPVAAGRLVDAFPVSLLSASTLARLERLQPGLRFEQERFRMNVMVEPVDAGAAEVDWIGHVLSLGPKTQLEAHIPAPRCVMVTRAQADIAEDLNILRALVQHSRMPVPALGKVPCCGIYATVKVFGTVRLGDDVAMS
jgi:uncharacterized protein YcbX